MSETNSLQTILGIPHYSRSDYYWWKTPTSKWISIKWLLSRYKKLKSKSTPRRHRVILETDRARFDWAGTWKKAWKLERARKAEVLLVRALASSASGSLYSWSLCVVISTDRNQTPRCLSLATVNLNILHEWCSGWVFRGLEGDIESTIPPHRRHVLCNIQSRRTCNRNDGHQHDNALMKHLRLVS